MKKALFQIFPALLVVLAASVANAKSDEDDGDGHGARPVAADCDHKCMQHVKDAKWTDQSPLQTALTGNGSADSLLGGDKSPGSGSSDALREKGN